MKRRFNVTVATIACLSNMAFAETFNEQVTIDDGNSAQIDLVVSGDASVAGDLTVGGGNVLTDLIIDPALNIYTNDYITATNPYILDQKLYHPLLTNILFLAPQQFDVSATLDASAIPTSQVAYLFDGNHHDENVYASGGELVITIDFSQSNYLAPSQGLGYGAGELVLAAYDGTTHPSAVSARIYSPTHNWLPLSKLPDLYGVANGDIYGNGKLWFLRLVSDNHSPSTKLEITITMDPGCSLSELEFHPQKPYRLFQTPVVTKYQDEILYNDISFYDSSKTESINFDAEAGAITARELVIDGFTLDSSNNTLVFEDSQSSGNASIEIGAANPVMVFQDTNMVFGEASGNLSSITGADNLVFGNSAAQNLTTGFNNIALGEYSLGYADEGDGNIALGAASMINAAGPNSRINIAIGGWTLSRIKDYMNIAIGNAALRYQETGSFQIAIGTNAMGGSGAGSAPGNTSYSLAIGYAALNNLDNGTHNLAIGGYAGDELVTGYNNTFVGAGAAGLLTTGSHNALFGGNAGSALTYGDYNSMFGRYAGDNLVTGHRNIAIGYQATFPNANASDQLNIGNTIYGDLATDKVGIGVTDPQATLDVGGDAIVSGNADVGGDLQVAGTITMTAPAGDISMGIFGTNP
ncbi:hypothetical protein [Cerasicoccus arenae]|uniref:Uncharacterized protein n=1 Tax=Cerasicoccus arenae TaxID=424488 RepID=A0A8J3GES2_9BACT|nr:hypothetical protein [Cerasicoccus arenae]MBK1858192.1 hypothetical protein [Cerasicoccus arenae]GHC00930.1 hypothetical protein GCM10007047_16610 [Cerasicoccus arenae]